MAYAFNPDRSKAPVYTKTEIDQMDLVNDQALQQEVADRVAAVSGEAFDRSNADSALGARITNLATLQDGSTTGDAELIDARDGYNDVVYSSAGEAIRKQLKLIGDQISIPISGLIYEDGYMDGTVVRPQQGNNGEKHAFIYNLINVDKIRIEFYKPQSAQLWGRITYYDIHERSIYQDAISVTANNFEFSLKKPDNAVKAAVSYRSFNDVSGVFNVYSESIVCNYPIDPVNDLSNLTPLFTTNESANVYRSFGVNQSVIVIDTRNLSCDYLIIYNAVSSNPNNKDYLLSHSPMARIPKGAIYYLPVFCKDMIYIGCKPSALGGAGSYSIYTRPILDNTRELALMLSHVRRDFSTIDCSDWYWGSLNGIVPSGSTDRISIKLPDINAETISISFNYNDYDIAYVTIDKSTKQRIYDSGWITDRETPLLEPATGFISWITIRKKDNTQMSSSDFALADVKVSAINGYYEQLPVRNEFNELSDRISNIENSAKINFNTAPFRFKPVYDHLFVNKTTNAQIPHESLYHVRLSKRLGYNIIEANLAKTSDGVFIVNHLSSGKFGNYFHHVDDITDISNIAVSSVTWDWIVQNVRYNSTLVKYRTRPCRLEEFLGECRQQNIIPFASSTDGDAIAILNKYMGPDNYIAYGGTRENCPNAIIYHWVTRTTKADILAYCQNIGAPFIYGMANPTAFSDSDLKDIVDTLHENGFWIGVSYADSNWAKYSDFGFDFNGSQTMMNRIAQGNICNFSTIFGFEDFTVTNATEANGILTFNSEGDIVPNIDNNVRQLCGIDIQVSYIGTINFQIGGEFGNLQQSSDGKFPQFFTVPKLNQSPRITLTCGAGTIVNDISFKASEF